MRKFLLVVLSVVFFSFPARADKNEKIKEMVSLLNYDKLIKQTVDQQLFAPIDCVFVIPATDRDTVKQQLSRVMNMQKLFDKIFDFLSQNLNEEELDDLLAFYKSPGGKKLITLQADMSKFFAKAFSEWGKEMGPQMDKFASELESKYGQRSKNEAQACIMAKQK